MMLKREGGFSLLEILISMLLLAAVSAAALFSFSSTTRATTGGHNVAYNWGRSILEEMHEYVRADTWGNASLPLSTTTPGPQPRAQQIPAGGTNYSATWTVTSMDPDGDTDEDYRRVVMTVSW